MALLAKGLLPASFRGVPFAVQTSDFAGGQRIALHQYPGRDEPWPEEMGRAPRRYRFRGFIVDGDVVFFGGPIQLQRALLIAALEKEGEGVLTHPTLGVLSVKVPQFSIGENLGAGTWSSLEIEFIESGKKNPASILSTSSGLLTAANLGKVALAADGVRAIALASSLGARRSDITSTAASWATSATDLAGDATALHRLTAQLPGSFGRFAGGANVGLNGRRASSVPEDASFGDLVALASERRSSVSIAAASLAATAAAVNLSDAQLLAQGVVAMVDALAAACAEPADAIRLLEQLIATQPLGQAAATAAGIALSSMVRRAAIAALADVIDDYQPSSADDAAARISEIAAVIDAEATVAGDLGDDASYRALRSALGAIVQSLRADGATIAQIRNVHSERPAPALVLAQRLYRDADRADQLVTQVPANPNPLFMPLDFQALAA